MQYYNSFSELPGADGCGHSVFNSIEDVESALQSANDQLTVLRSLYEAGANAGRKYYKLAEFDDRRLLERSNNFEELQEILAIRPGMKAEVSAQIEKVNDAILQEYQEIAALKQTNPARAQQRLNNLLRLQNRTANTWLGDQTEFGEGAFTIIPTPPELEDLAPKPSTSPLKFKTMEEAALYFGQKPTRNACYRSFQEIHNAANYEAALDEIDKLFIRKHEVARTSAKKEGYNSYDLVPTESLEEFTQRWVAQGGDYRDAAYNYEQVYPEYKRSNREIESAARRAKETVLRCLDTVDFDDPDDLDDLPVFIGEAVGGIGAEIDKSDISLIEKLAQEGNLAGIKEMVNQLMVPKFKPQRAKRAPFKRPPGPKYTYKFGVCTDSAMSYVPPITEQLIDLAEQYATPADKDLYDAFTILIRGIATDERRHDRLVRDIEEATTGKEGSRFVGYDSGKPLAQQLHPEYANTAVADKLNTLDRRAAEIDSPERLQTLMARFKQATRSMTDEDKNKVYDFLHKVKEYGIKIPGMTLDDLSIRRALGLEYTDEQKQEMMRSFTERFKTKR